MAWIRVWFRIDVSSRVRIRTVTTPGSAHPRNSIPGGHFLVPLLLRRLCSWIIRRLSMTALSTIFIVSLVTVADGPPLRGHPHTSLDPPGRAQPNINWSRKWPRPIILPTPHESALPFSLELRKPHNSLFNLTHFPGS